MATRTKYEINGVLDTNKNVLANMNEIANVCGSFVTWDPSDGMWSVIINDVGTSVKAFTDSNIIGSINVSGSGINELYNAGSIEFPHKDLQDTRDYVDVKVPDVDRYSNELDNRLNMTTELVNDPVQAQYIISREVKQSRIDKIISFRTDYTANGLKAGDLIDITSDMYGYTNKMFRITTITEDDSDDGSLVYSITALEYDANVYNTSGLVREFRTKKTGVVPKSANTALQQSDSFAGLTRLALTSAAEAHGLRLSLDYTPPYYTWIIDYTTGGGGGGGGGGTGSRTAILWMYGDTPSSSRSFTMRAKVISPDIGQTSPIGKASPDTNRYFPSVDPVIIILPGDNNGNGNRTVAVDIEALATNAPQGTKYIIIEMKGYWRYKPEMVDPTPVPGNPLNCFYEIWKGGDIISTGYDFAESAPDPGTYYSSGDAGLIYEATVNATEATVGINGEGDLVGYFIYNLLDETHSMSANLPADYTP